MRKIMQGEKKMKRFIISLLALTLLAGTVVLPVSAADKQTETISYTYDAGRWDTHTREMEKLGRGLVAVKTDGGVFLSWRLLDSEDSIFGSAKNNVSFYVYRGNTKIAEVAGSTNYLDTTAGTSYSVAPVVNGVEGEKCAAVSVQNGNYFDIQLQKPADATLADGSTAPYTANDASCGDIDGDGEYEIVLKWDANGKDNSQSGYTGNVLLDAYKLDGTKLWRIDLGQNVRAGAHYTQFLVYDFDLDGEAEMMCQTAPSSKDSAGNYVTRASHVDDIKSISDADNQNSYINDGGYNLTSDEFLTVFESDGTAADTIYYPNQRINASVWGDDYGNRCDRFTATVAYMDGKKPYGVYMRGYYFGQSGYGQRQAACAVSYDGSVLSCTHSFDTYNPSSYRYKTSSASYANGVYKGVDGYKAEYAKFVGNGNHNCAVADMDGDGKDEVTTGSLCYEFKEDGTLAPKWCTFLEHGDALHIGDYDPTHEGFEFFTVHEDGGPNTESGTEVQINFGMSVIDPGVTATDPTDEAYKNLVMFHQDNSGDTGRGMMADVGSGGYYQITGAGTYQNNGGKNFTAANNGMGNNFRIFWDGDLYDELLNGTTITSYNGRRMTNIFSASGCTQINGTKANPALQADLFGDWREEVAYPTSDNNYLRVYSTTTETNYKIKTLMQDPVYRMGVSAEQTAYNQPPHVGIYMGKEMFDLPTVKIEIIAPPDKTTHTLGDELDITGLRVKATLSDNTEKEVSSFIVTGYDPNTAGTQHLTVSYMGQTAQFDVTVKAVTGISVTPPSKTEYTQGEALNTDGMVITATYDDGTTTSVSENYTVTGYNSMATGDQDITVTYAGKTDTFTVTVVAAEGLLSDMDGTYETSSTSSSNDRILIGSYAGDFSIQHTVTINALPANGNINDRNSTAGFFMRFDPPNGVGGGWTFVNSNGNIGIYWKSTSAVNVANNIQIGEMYTFKYDFTEVGTGNGAAVTLTITDSRGNLISTNEGLNLRNLSNDNQRISPWNIVTIYNQANANSTSSVTITDAKLVVPEQPPVSNESKIVAVSGGNIFIDCDSTNGLRAFAAKYNNGSLERLAELAPLSEGEDVYTPGFAPDKVFLWTDGMQPIDYWEKAN